MLRLPQGHSRDDVRKKPWSNNLLADGPQNNTSHRQPITPSTALARPTETTDRIKLLTRRSTSWDGLWDVTRSALRTLRNQFNSRLCILRSLWYAEPFRLVAVGLWLTRIGRDMSIYLDTLDDRLRTTANQPTYNQAWTSDSDDEDICPQQDGRQTVDNVKPYKIHTPVHSQNPGLSTTNSTQSYVFAPSNGYGDNTPIDKPQVSRDCWPAAGECHLCGFGPQQRMGIICIGHTKVCDYCRTRGHITKACKKGPGSDIVKPSTLANAPVQDPKKRVPQQIKTT